MQNEPGYACSCGIFVPFGVGHQCYRGEPYRPYIQPIPLTQMGWICPVCGVIHSPSTLRCYCNIVDYTNTTTGTR
jgi:hypothetical protein